MNEAPLDWQKVAARLREAGHHAPVEYRAVTGSTNDDARQLALAGAGHGTVVLADAQESGRGRRGAVWVSPPRRNLICSVILRPEMPMEHWARLTHACALAVSEMLERVPELPGPQIKWPNDVYLSGRKVCGILVESALDARGGFAVAGAGINLNLTTGDLPESLHGTATSVWLERGGQEICREDCAADFILRLMANAQRAALDFPALLAECERRSFLTGRVIRVHQGDHIIEGLAAGLGPAGELMLRTDDGSTHAITTADLVRPV